MRSDESSTNAHHLCELLDELCPQFAQTAPRSAGVTDGFGRTSAGWHISLSAAEGGGETERAGPLASTHLFVRPDGTWVFFAVTARGPRRIEPPTTWPIDPTESWLRTTFTMAQ